MRFELMDGNGDYRQKTLLKGLMNNALMRDRSVESIRGPECKKNRSCGDEVVLMISAAAAVYRD